MIIEVEAPRSLSRLVLMRQLLFKGLVLCTFTAMLSRVWLPQTVILRALVAGRLETPELPVRSAVPSRIPAD
jgi:hypothetical protein